MILAKQFCQGPEKMIAELSGGGVDDGESPEVAAKREFTEETGYSGELQYIGYCYVDAYSLRRTNIFVAMNCEKVEEPKNDPNEMIEVVLMDIESFKKHLRSGELSDTSTIYRALDYLKFL